MPKVILVNPAVSTVGYSFFTPRWLFVIAQATPMELVGDPVIVDETLERFHAGIVNPGDIVGIGISTGNCTAGYRVLRDAKLRGATVIMGGVHPTILPDEPIEMGADAIVTGNGDIVWAQVIRDALDNKLRRRYDGGRVPGDALLKARWDLLDPQKYLFATVQTVAGCPENCSFCSVWVTDGRRPRQRLTDKIIEEVKELHELGFRCISFADDNFNPATLARIAREPSPQRRKELERIRENRLKFFDEYDRLAPRDMCAITQMTSEIVRDEEYLSAMVNKARIRAALVGVESYSDEGLETANKQWNPVGQKMVETIRRIQDSGIMVLSSIICGLESDTVESIRSLSKFAIDSGSMLAQFIIYSPYPGTKDYYEMIRDSASSGNANHVAKHKTQLRQDKFWLTNQKPVDIIRHSNLNRDELIEATKRCWDAFYKFREMIKRTRQPLGRRWSLAEKITYIVASLVFKRVYVDHGLSADSVQAKRMGVITKVLIKTAVGVYSYFFRHRRIGLRVSLSGRKSVLKSPFRNSNHPEMPPAVFPVGPEGETQQ